MSKTWKKLYKCKRKLKKRIIRAHFAPSPFSFPEGLALKHIICIATGAGIAPFRAFFQEKSVRITGCYSHCTLYYGCRSRDEDFLYAEEIEQYARTNIINMLRIAFSRNAEKATSDGKTKNYV